ncbi:hypothetical protein HCN52_09505 [Streptomyces bohaiensis]|uniref:PE-PGRS family protein n=1 Tax=Streptomyces bohaiensis TaxID=1431344 RepID=A0ABX1CCQ6_9ACTN|nr:hypothetical protein [Streptomyces bohaiensis]
MRVPVSGQVYVHYSQIYVESEPEGGPPPMDEAFAGQRSGLCGAAVPGALWLITGLHTGRLGFVVEIHDEEPPLDPTWEDVVEVSFRPQSDRSLLVQWAGEAVWELGLDRTDHRVRYCARGMDEGNRLDTAVDEPAPDSYLLQFWSAPPRSDRVIRQTSRYAASRHRYARALPPPPTPEQRAEAERLAREAQERAEAAQERESERRQWGGQLPSPALRAVGGNVRGLLRYDSDLVHLLAASSPDVQRAVARLAARRACEAAGLTEVPWFADALTALEAERPLPPPFHDAALLEQALVSDPRLPRRSVPPAIPPQGEPGSVTVFRDDYTSVIDVGDSPLRPETPVQAYAASPAVRAAAEREPLRAAVEAVWHAVHTTGDQYTDLLTEIRSACARPAEE